MKRIAVIVLLSATGCRKASQAAPDAAVAEAPMVRPVEGQLTLTSEMLDAYLKYQHAALSAGGAADSGAYDRAARDEVALKSSGLTDAQLLAIDEMLSAVVARRMVTQLAANPEFMPDMAAMQNTLNDEQKKRMAEAMAAFKQQQADAKDLSDERKRFGTKNINLLLSREAELTKAWTDLMGIAPLQGH